MNVGKDTDLDKIWSLMDNFKNSSIKDKDNLTQNSKLKSNIYYCTTCNVDTYDSTCNQCGLIIYNDTEYSNYSYEEPQNASRSFKKSNNLQGNRLMKINEWIMWTNDEKNEYKLNKYTKELCEKLNILEGIISSVCGLVSQIMTAIKNGCDGPKRSRVKDGIIIVCIYYVSKNTSNSYSYIDLAKKIDLNMKYISKADKLIMELINSNKLKMSKECLNNFLQPENPIDFVTRIIEKYNLNINQSIIDQVSNLIEICEDNDILLDHTPLSIGVTCFYVLNINNIDINIKMFSQLYDLSMVTVMKTYNKLKLYKTRFEKLNIKCLN